jgi:hypothetical protein
MTITQYDPNRISRLTQAIGAHVVVGWAVETQTDTMAVLKSGSKPNHVLHLLLTLATCGLWAIVWLPLGLTQKERRLTLTLNPDGSVSSSGAVASS